MIKLKNVSKFYYNKGIITSGFSKINLELNIGEFVAIVGESGSGKSTLLNVISGLDTYEEGELYINGEETSHYTESDFEEYRRKYIANIFQNFNLVNSYTVYQNIELVLLLNGFNKREIKKKVIELIKKVDLYKYRNTKVSKLSGGQKQRVAIARALAKDTPIIVADEPTGNLDSVSAQGIIKLLSEIAKNKLVIIVTHNYQQIESYVTRTIKMHDGKIIEDTIHRKIEEVEYQKDINYKNITLSSKFRLGIRNSVNILPKFMLLLVVFLFVISSLTSEYASFKNQEYLSAKEGYNYYFFDLSLERIILNKKNGEPFNSDDYNKILSLSNIDKIEKNDILIDTDVELSDEKNLWLTGIVKDINKINTVDLGKLPENDNEIVISKSKKVGYYYDFEEFIGKELYIYDPYSGLIDRRVKLQVVGVKYDDSNIDRLLYYVSPKIATQITNMLYQHKSETRILFEDTYYTSEVYTTNLKLIPLDTVPKGKVYIPSMFNYNCPKQNCINRKMDIEVSTIYYNDKITLEVSDVYDKDNFKKLVGDYNYDIYNSALFVNSSDYENLYNKGNYQASIYVKDIDKLDKTISELNDFGFRTLAIKKLLVSSEMTAIIRIFKTVVTIVFVITLFFISYFVVKLIMKSRNVYYSIVRILGASKKTVKDLLVIDLLTVFNIAYLIYLLCLYLNYKGIISVNSLTNVCKYLKLNDAIILYIILFAMSYLISIRYSIKLFKKSSMNTIREEV